MHRNHLVHLPGKNVANLSMAAGSLAAGGAFLITGDPATGLVRGAFATIECHD